VLWYSPKLIVFNLLSREAFLKATGIEGTESIESAIEFREGVEVIILAVKPQVIIPVCEDVARSIANFRLKHNQNYKPLIISIAAGVRISLLESILQGTSKSNERIIRTMPNIAALVRHSSTAYSLGGSAGEECKRQVEAIFGLKFFFFIFKF
jgi:pyrroline-5-carboxylate reductase